MPVVPRPTGGVHRRRTCIHQTRTFRVAANRQILQPRPAMNPFDAASPFDARYYFADADFYRRLHPYVSETSQVRYLARVEAALAETLAAYGVCPPEAAREIAGAVDQVTPDEVYAEERRIQHNIRALVNCIRNRISP